MNVLPIVKTVVGIATSFGAGAVIGNAIKATTPPNLKLVSKVFIGLGALGISGALGDIAGSYMESQIQAFADGARIGKAVGDRNEGASLSDFATDLKETASDVINHREEAKDTDTPNS